MEDILNSFNADPAVATEIVELVGVDIDDFSSTIKTKRIKDIVDFFAGYDDRRFMINKLLAGKGGIDKVDHLWQYIKVRDELESSKRKLSEMSTYLKDSKDEQSTRELKILSSDIQHKIKQLNEEVALFEK